MAGVKGVLIAIDQLCNALAGGEPDETLSARAWRLRTVSPFWRRVQPVIDCLFLDGHHCEDSYYAEFYRKQLPSEYRKGHQ